MAVPSSLARTACRRVCTSAFARRHGSANLSEAYPVRLSSPSLTIVARERTRSVQPLCLGRRAQRRFHSTAPTAQKACAQCNETLAMNTLACPSCGTLQPLPSELDAYSLLGLDKSKIGSNGWDVDLSELKAIWRKQMALTHPDRMGGKGEKEQQIAAQQSAMLNKAYETLREPLLRAHLLLEQLSSSAPSEAESLDDPEVLMEVMELREELEEASSEHQMTQIQARNQKYLDATLNTIRDAFGQSPPNVESARKAAVGLRYWTNIDKATREWEPGKRVELQH